MSFLGGLLGKIGRGITSTLDDSAYDTAGIPLMGSLLADPSPGPALPQQGLRIPPRPITGTGELGAPIAGGTAPMGGLIASDLPPSPNQQAAALRAQQQALAAQQPYQPDKATKSAMRGGFVQALLNGINLAATGRGNMGDAMRDYRNNTLDMLLLQHQAKVAGMQQARQQEASAGLAADMQQAGDDPDLQRQALQKWGAFVHPDTLKAFGDIAKDYRKPVDELSQIITSEDDSGLRTYLPFYKSGRRGDPYTIQGPQKFQQQGTDTVNPKTHLGLVQTVMTPDGKSTFQAQRNYDTGQWVRTSDGKSFDVPLVPWKDDKTPINDWTEAVRQAGGDPTNINSITPEIGAKARSIIEQTKRNERPMNTFNLGQARLDAADRKQMIKLYEPASDAAVTFNTMAKNWNDAFGDPAHPNQQAMISLLAQHIAMTTGKGGANMRPTQAIFEEAKNTLPLVKQIKAKFGPDGLMSGVTLDPSQGWQMVQLGHDRYRQKLQESRANASMYDVNRTIDPGGRGPVRIPDTATVAYYHNLAMADPRVAGERNPDKQRDKAMAVTKELMDNEGWQTTQ